ncbi:MAG: ATP-dependent helicase DinG [Bacillales bacterium]|jgi:ATP-dependent DNA helicase DinG|nr:ATP-dependent helicase DinG [Bacillales bacterium]
MLGNFVVVDIETTGNKVSSGDTIIQFSAVRVFNNEIVDQFTTFVNPHMPIPDQITYLTNIRDIDVSKAPSFDLVINEITQFIGDSIFVAHNVNFDFEFLNNLLIKYGRKPLENTTFDTVEFSRVLLPLSPSYKLEDLSTQFNIKLENHHRADEDALATAKLLLVLLDKWVSIPLIVKLRMLPHLNNLQNNYDFLIEDENLRDYDEQIYINLTEKNLLIGNPNREIKKELINNEWFKQREEQEQIKNYIKNSIHEDKSSIIEAPPGTGKTLAYLLGGLQSGSRLVVSTSTIALQDQLIKKEVPKVEQILSKQLKTTLLKGKSNYLCLNRFVTSLSKTKDTYDISLTKAQILLWLLETTTGDRDELTLTSGGSSYWENICCNDSCLGSNHNYCSYKKTINELESSDIIITNHHTLLKSLLRLNYDLLTKSVIVIDEAHQLEKVINSCSIKSTEIKKILFYISKLGTIDNEKSLGCVSGIVSKHYGNVSEFYSVNTYLSRARIQLEQIVEGIKILAKKDTEIISDKDIELLQKHVNLNSWQSIALEIEACSTYINKFYLDFSSVLPRQDLAVLDEFMNYLSKLSQQIRYLIDFFNENQFLRWIEIERSIYYEAKLQVHNSNPDDIYSNFLNDNKLIKILISGSLSVKNNFKYFKNNLNINTQYNELIISNSYFNNIKLFVPDNLPSISKSPNEICMLVFKHLKEYIKSNEKVLVLFTSHEMLRQTYIFASRHSNLKNIIFAQNITSSSKQKLTKMFINSKEGILFGTETFWEGVDFPGNLLTTLIIVRLPFLPPNHPYIQVRAKKDSIKNSDKFSEICLPDSIFRFKQGVGRLIRNDKDTGKLIIFDKRIVESNYKSLFLNAIGNPQINSFTIKK